MTKSVKAHHYLLGIKTEATFITIGYMGPIQTPTSATAIAFSYRLGIHHTVNSSLHQGAYRFGHEC